MTPHSTQNMQLSKELLRYNKAIHFSQAAYYSITTNNPHVALRTAYHNIV